MKKLILILTTFISLNSALAATIQYRCDLPTAKHSDLTIMLDSGTTVATVLTADNEKNLRLYTAQVEKGIVAQLGKSLLNEPIVMIGTTDHSEIMSSYSIYTESISLVLMQQIAGKAGTLSVYLTENNKVSVYSCDLKK